MTALLPCPFCGAPAHTYKAFDNPEDWEFTSNWAIECKHDDQCGLAVHYDNHFPTFKTETAAAAGWNRRDGNTA